MSEFDPLKVRNFAKRERIRLDTAEWTVILLHQDPGWIEFECKVNACSMEDAIYRASLIFFNEWKKLPHSVKRAWESSPEPMEVY